MANADAKLRILVELGVLGQADLDAVNKLLEETTEGQSDLAKEMGVVNVTGEESKKILSQLGGANEELTKKTSSAAAQKMALTKLLVGLNSIVPGLGTSMNALSNAMRSEAAAAGQAASSTAAFGAALKTVGPLLIVMLSIEAVKTYWDIFQSKAKEGAEAYAQATEKIRNAAKVAREEHEKMQRELKGGDKTIVEENKDALGKSLQAEDDSFAISSAANKARIAKAKAEGLDASKLEADQIQLEFDHESRKADLKLSMAMKMQNQEQQFKNADQEAVNREQDQYKRNTAAIEILEAMGGKQEEIAKVEAENQKIIEDRKSRITKNREQRSGFGDFRQSLFDEVESSTQSRNTGARARGAADDVTSGRADQAAAKNQQILMAQFAYQRDADLLYTAELKALMQETNGASAGAKQMTINYINDLRAQMRDLQKQIGRAGQ